MTVDTSYLVGNPVYQGGSPQPTQGTVDPTGYVQRELDNQTSDSRSGLAAAALNGGTQPTTPAPTPVPAGTVNPTRNDIGQYYHVAAPSTGTEYSGGPVGVTVTYPNGQTANEFYTPKTQEEYNNLASNGWKYNVTADMSSLMQSPQVAQGLDALTSSELSQRNAITQAMQNRLSDITQAEAQTQEQLPQELAANRAGFGGRGMLFSSGFANSEQNLLDAVARRMAGFEQDANTERVDSNTKLQSFLDSLNQRRVGLYGQQAEYDNKQLQDADVRSAIERQLGLLGGKDVIPGQKMPTPAPTKTPVKAPTKAKISTPLKLTKAPKATKITTKAASKAVAKKAKRSK